MNQVSKRPDKETFEETELFEGFAPGLAFDINGRAVLSERLALGVMQE
jgi:hypothetical protein